MHERQGKPDRELTHQVATDESWCHQYEPDVEMSSKGRFNTNSSMNAYYLSRINRNLPIRRQVTELGVTTMIHKDI
jgi:hypothetical protein